MADKTSVLMIEDDLDAAKLFKTILERAAYKVISVTSGTEGIAQAIENRPDIILCDIMMPEMSGFDVLTKLKTISSTAAIPFIFLTALSDSARHEGMGLGADDFLHKGQDRDIILTRIRARLDRNKQLQTERLQNFARHLVSVQERERIRIAHSLRGKILSELKGLKFTLSLADSSPQETQASIHSDAVNLLNELIAELEEMSNSLHPTILEHLGLLPTIVSLINRYSLTTQFHHTELEYDFAPKIKIAVFRILQEGLDNIAEHAQADKVSIAILNHKTHLEIEIKDSGVGFDIEEKLHSVRPTTGLMSIYERVASLDGTINIKSSAEIGTSINIHLPLEEVLPLSKRMVSNTELSKLLGHTTGTTGELRKEENIKVVIADEMSIMRKGLRRLLQQTPNFSFAAEVAQLEQVASVVAEHQPNLLIINPFSDGQSRYNTVQEVAEQYSATNVLIISSDVEKSHVIEAFRSGAKGFIPNDATINDLYTGIAEVGRGKFYISPTIPSDEILSELKI